MSTVASSPRRFPFRFAAVPDFILADVEASRLKRGDVAILSRLIRVARGGLVDRMTDDDLARLCGVSESTFKAALRRLRATGHVLVIRVKSRWRRELVLTWLSTSEGSESRPPRGRIFDPSGRAGGQNLDPRGVRISTPEGSESRPPTDSPLTLPPCEGIKEDEEEDDKQEASSSSSFAPLEGSGDGPVSGPSEALKAQAARIWRPGPALTQVLAEGLATADEATVAKALDVCVARARRETIGPGFFFGTLKNLLRNGPDIVLPAKLTTAETMAREAAQRARDRAPIEAPAPTEAEVEEQRERLRSGDRIQKNHARLILAGWGLDP